MELLFKFNSWINRRKNFWWIEISTTTPCCIYFFGPFNSLKEARRKQNAYIDDLVKEKFFGITIEIKQS